MPKKAKGRSLGRQPFTEVNMERMAWCMRNRIGIAVMPDWSTLDKWIVEIIIKDKTNVDPNRYTAAEANAKRWEYYDYYYNKYKK